MKRLLIPFVLLLLLANSVMVVSAASPAISTPFPSDGATNVILTSGKINLRANVTDADGDLAYISFNTNKSGTWAKIADISLSGENWTTGMPIVFSNLLTGHKYWWQINSKDAQNHWTNSSAFSFTTQTNSSSNSTGNGSITIVPSQPKSNSNIIFIISKATASGYIICSESSNVYPFQITNKMGVVQLGAEYGLATVVIVDYGTRQFSITSPYATTGELAIEMPSSAKINADVSVAVTANGDNVPATVTFISPTDKQIIKRTKASGAIDVTFNEIGDWVGTAQLLGSIVTKQITIEAESLTIDMPSSASIGQEMTIATTAGATVVVDSGGTPTTLTADDQGNAYYTPETVGRYKVTATSDTAKGTDYFTVKTQSAIIAKNDKGFPVTSVSTGDIILLSVTDANGQQIAGSNVDVYGDGVLLTTLPLYGGSAIWRIDTSAKEYSIEFNPSGALYLPATLALTGGGGAIKWDAYYPYIAVAAVIIIAILVVAWRKGWLENLSGILFTKKEDDLL